MNTATMPSHFPFAMPRAAGRNLRRCPRNERPMTTPTEPWWALRRAVARDLASGPVLDRRLPMPTEQENRRPPPWTLNPRDCGCQRGRGRPMDGA